MDSLLTWREISEEPVWQPVMSAYESRARVEHFETYFERPSSIHGVRHAHRVLLHTLVLCRLCRVGESDRELLVSAALFHDIGRDNDGLCFTHGRRSAEKMAALRLAPADGEAAEVLRYIVTYHCIGDSRAEADLPLMPAAFRERAWRLYRVLKDADGLDRVRIGDLDERYLRNPEASRLTALAHELLAYI